MSKALPAALAVSALAMATGFVDSVLGVLNISLWTHLGVASFEFWIGRRRAALAEEEEQQKKDASRREFIQRLKGERSDSPESTREAKDVIPAQSGRLPALPRFLDSWPGALLATGAGVAAAVFSGLVTVAFLPEMVKYAALTATSLVLAALGRDWLAARLTGAAQRGSGLDWSPRGLLSRVSPLMTLALPIVAFSFTGILFGRAKGAADSDPSTSRRAAAALAGPAVNAGLALLGAAVAAGLAWVGAPEALVSLASTFIVVNVMAALVDLLPPFPLGGHDVLRHFVSHVLAAPRAAEWLDRHRGLQIAVLAGALFLGGGLVNEVVLRIFGILFWPAALASVP
jgi:hypothetical protein